jgi:predicted signal transduction protein with EAL and GGDEF domain
MIRCRARGVLATAVVLATVLLMAFARLNLGPSASFMPAVLAVIGCFDVLSMVLLAGIYLDTGDLRLLIMCWAYLVSLIFMGAYTLAFPGVLAHAPLASAPSVPPWFYLCWQIAFPVGLALAWAPWPTALPTMTHSPRRRRVLGTSLSLLAAVVVALSAVLVCFGPGLPVIIQGDDFRRQVALTGPVVLPLLAVATLVSWYGSRRRAGPERWTPVAVLVSLCGLVLIYVTRYRYTLGWYAGRCLTVVGAALVLIAMLAELRRLRNTAADRAALLAEHAALLAKAEAFNAAVLIASPDITVLTDLSTGSVVWSSRSLWEMLGWTPAQAAAKGVPDLDDLVAVEDRSRMLAGTAAVRLLADDECLTIRYRMLDAGGHHRWLSWRSTPFGRDEAGAVLQELSDVRDISDIMVIEQEMQHAGLHDPLTGLANRTLLIDRVSLAVARADRDGTEVVVLYCDLDGFKRVNDTAGHAAGDAILVEVADRLRAVLRKGDSIARVGGDEFVIVLDPTQSGMQAVPAQRRPDSGHSEPDTDQRVGLPARQLAAMLAERVRVELARPIEHAGQSHVVSASVGMTFARRGAIADDIVRDADAAMYLAKQRGKDRVEVYDGTLHADLLERRRVEHALRSALAPGGPWHPHLGVAYQPVIDLSDGRLVSFEALARLTDSEGQPIPPDTFISVAEDTGLIAGLGEAVLNTAMDGLVRWRCAHSVLPAATMAVNFSARQAQHVDMATLVREALTRHGLQPADLTLELTESVLLEAGSSTLQQLTELHTSGVAISIDDFGTGYASLHYLTTLPVSSVKVDKSFTAGLLTDANSATIVRAVAALAAEMGLACIVEGIETEHQLTSLPAGTLGQGFLLGRPTTEPQDAWLRTPSVPGR